MKHQELNEIEKSYNLLKQRVIGFWKVGITIENIEVRIANITKRPRNKHSRQTLTGVYLCLEAFDLLKEKLEIKGTLKINRSRKKWGGKDLYVIRYVEK